MRALAALLALLLTASLALAAEGTRYRVLREAKVDSDAVMLSDLVENAPASWSKVLVGAAPRAGRATQFSAELIRSRAQVVVSAASLDVEGPVTVRHSGREVTREEVEEAVTAAVAKRFGESVALDFDSVTLPNAVTEGETALRVRLPRGNLPTRTTLWVDVEVNGKVEGRASARVECRSSELRYVVVLTRAVKRGETIRTSDLELREGEGRLGTLTAIEQAAGKAATRSINAGSVLQEAQVADPILVEKGQAVRLVARVGRITATTVGKSLDKGAYGETVSVQNTASGQVVRAVVKEAGVAEALSRGGEVN